VALELIKDAGWSQTTPSFYHWHTAKREEVDVLMESRDGRLVGVEVKASSSVSSSDFKGLRALQKLVGEKFHRGILLYSGQHVLPFGEGLYAVPLSALWHGLAP
jgi:predicted AAA+ superfamily ATPase